MVFVEIGHYMYMVAWKCHIQHVYQQHRLGYSDIILLYRYIVELKHNR